VLTEKTLKDRTEAAAQRVHELMDAHMRSAGAGATHTVGDVSVTVNSKLQLTHVHIGEAFMDVSARATIEKSIVEAVNAATQQVVKSSSRALTELRSSEEWKATIGEIFGTRGKR
jgi:DNA-binding protein YbaB